ncbi:hypothetical protein [Streptomyces sp. NPDC020983]|uniref:hypothetical protein n=1 Tax=Streptomyces sp. NPDC020983 TaxID=3365106 RepID=UPI0037BB64A1
MSAPIGDLLDSLGVTATIDEGELVASAVVLLRVIQQDGAERLSLVHSDGQGWTERLGMLHAATAVETPSTPT